MFLIAVEGSLFYLVNNIYVCNGHSGRRVDRD